jgi:hypothetical protein
MLHDIGTAVDYDDHHKHSRYLILSAGLPGFSPRETALIGQICRYHRKGTPALEEFEALARKGDAARLDRMAATVRLAEQLERSRDQVVRDVDVEVRDGRVELRLHAGLGPQDARFGLEIAALVAARPEGRPAPGDRIGIEPLVRDAEALGGGESALEEAGPAVEARVVGRRRRDDEPARRLHQPRAGLRLERAPERVRALHQRHEFVPFADRQARDARGPVARAAVVRRAKAVDADHRHAAAREVAQHRAARGAETDDDDVRERSRHRRIVCGAPRETNETGRYSRIRSIGRQIGLA